MPGESKIKHAWYSREQHERKTRYQSCSMGGSPSVLWRSVDTGRPILCTMVSDTKKHGVGWKDMKYLGKVDKFIGVGSEALLNTFSDDIELLYGNETVYVERQSYARPAGLSETESNLARRVNAALAAFDELGETGKPKPSSKPLQTRYKRRVTVRKGEISQ